MQSNPHKLTVIDGETLMDKRLPPTKFCVDTLLPQGLCILGGSPKVGKSWPVLDLCVHVAQGTPLWGLDVTRGDVLYLCLEDSERRIQERLNTITDNVPDGMYFATGCTSIESGVCDWLRDFKRQHPEVSFIAIDTFQLIRTPTPEVSYGGDYAELRVLKELADELGICLLLVHHLRKMNDRDPVNKLSGSTGISGAVDAIFVLDKNERIERFATLYASGRDIRDRKIQLELDKDACVWTLIADSLTMPETMLPDEMAYVFGFVWRSKNHGFVGTNTELAQHVSIALEDRSYGHYQLISDFVRDCVFKKEMIIITGANDVATELRRIGNNVNQLTRAVNAGFVSQINLTETRKELEKIWQSLNSLLQNAR